MKKWLKVTALSILTLFLLATSYEVILAVKNPFLWEFWAHYFQSLFANTTPEWKTYLSPDGRLSLESPFPMKWDKIVDIKNGKGCEVINGDSQHNRTGFSIDAHSTLYINLKAKPSFDKASLDIFKHTFQNEPNFQWHEQATICSGLPAALISYSFDIRKNSFHYLRLLVNGENESWDITLKTYKNTDSFNEWSMRVVQSIKIQPK